MDTVTRGNCLDLLYSLSCNEASSLGERLQSALQCKGYPLQQTSVEHIGNWLTVENTMNIGLEGHTCGHLPQPS